MKPGQTTFPSRVNHAGGLDLGDVASKDADGVALYADCGVDPGIDAAVQYQAALDQQVVHSLSPYIFGVYAARADGGLTYSRYRSAIRASAASP